MQDDGNDFDQEETDDGSIDDDNHVDVAVEDGVEGGDAHVDEDVDDLLPVDVAH